MIKDTSLLPPIDILTGSTCLFLPLKVIYCDFGISLSLVSAVVILSGTSKSQP